MKEQIESYKNKVASELCAYTECDVTAHSLGCVTSLAECWEALDAVEKRLTGGDSEYVSLTEADAEAWNKAMRNADGTHGGHWTVEQTTAAAKAADVELDGMPPYLFNVVMNMMYSDYCKAAKEAGVDNAGFYAHMAEAFLHDEDARGSKVGRYFREIVEL